jgi:galactose oxidase-like protein
VVVAGGNPDELDSAELYDPATGTWSATDSLNDGRADHVGTLLPNGMVLVAGGTSLDIDSAELYDPAARTWSLTGSLNTPRKDHAATLLANGMVLVTGGALSHRAPLASAELYDPGIVVATKVEGHGTIKSQRDRVTFQFRASQSNDSTSANYFFFCDPAARVCLANSEIRNLSINGNTAQFSGRAQLDGGTKVRYKISVTDNGRPGTLDTITINLSDGYSSGGTLSAGDIRIY